jgi:molybdopterin adenylyltransferase
MHPATHIRVGIVTVSDRAAQGIYADLGGPALKSKVRQLGWEAAAEAIVPDDKARIQEAIRAQVGTGCHVVLATGGTGVGLRDVTPESILEIASRELPGFGEKMRLESMKITPNAILSRSLAAVVGRTLVICLPGKPSGAVECLGFVAEAVPHCVDILQQNPVHQPIDESA